MSPIESPSAVTRTALPLTILSGYLGAGKTTLLRRLLGAPHGRRIGVLVNDFGSVGLDASLLEGAAAETIELVNGCVCCALADDLGRGLDTLLGLSEPLDQVIVETSGVADPNRLASLARTWPGYRFDGIFVCADMTRIRTLVADRFVGTTVTRQLAAADVIIRTHLDRLPDAGDARQWLATIAPRAHQVPASEASTLLLSDLALPPPALAARTNPGPANTTAPDALHSPAETFRTWHEQFDRPLPRSSIDAIMTAQPSLLRAKGELWLNEAPEHRFVLQRVGNRWEIVDDGPWGERRPATRIDCIAPHET